MKIGDVHAVAYRYIWQDFVLRNMETNSQTTVIFGRIFPLFDKNFSIEAHKNQVPRQQVYILK